MYVQEEDSIICFVVAVEVMSLTTAPASLRHDLLHRTHRNVAAEATYI
jgi:hypothetical protein